MNLWPFKRKKIRRRFDDAKLARLQAETSLVRTVSEQKKTYKIIKEARHLQENQDTFTQDLERVLGWRTH